jgi:hypothetical protein
VNIESFVRNPEKRPMIILGPTQTFYADDDAKVGVEYVIIDGDEVYVLFKATADKPKHVRHFKRTSAGDGD